MNLKRIFHVYMFNMDISLNIKAINIKFSTGLKNIRMKGTISKIFYLGFSFHFMANKSDILRLSYGIYLTFLGDDDSTQGPMSRSLDTLTGVLTFGRRLKQKVHKLYNGSLI